MSKGDAWIRVRDEAELRRGLLVRFGCIYCPSMSLGLLMESVPLQHEHTDHITRHSTVWRFKRLSCCCAETESRVATNGNRLCALWCIDAGLLRRLAPDATHETTNTRTRERVGAGRDGR